MTSGEEKRNQEKEVPVPMMSDYGTDSLIAHWKKLQVNHHIVVRDSIGVSDAASVQIIPQTPISANPDVLIQAAIIVIGPKTDEGHLIEAVSIPWFEIVKELERDPEFLFKIPPRKLEELIAGAYKREGWPEVELTPLSGDRGRDVIATKPGIGSIRIIDQVKRYAPNHRVKAADVREILGVLNAQRNVSKGIITTTSQFAPGIYKDEDIKAFMPHRLELRDGKVLKEWLTELGKRRGH